MIAKWADSGAPQGNPADLPPPRAFPGQRDWQIGTPDLVLRSPDITFPAVAPDTWGYMGQVPTGLTEDRWVAAVEVREINDLPSDSKYSTVGAKFVFHHMAYSALVPGNPSGTTSFTAHNAERNPFFYPAEAPKLLHANSVLSFDNYHMHANGRETRAHLEFAFKFYPKGHQPLYRRAGVPMFQNSADFDLKANTAGQEMHSYGILTQHMKILHFDPHMHASGVRVCLDAVWGTAKETLTCAGNDYGFVRNYAYADDAAPLLPKGTIIHIVGYFDNSRTNRNITDPRNWQGTGRRSVSNMWAGTVEAVALTDEQFEAEVTRRRARLKDRNDYDIGCLQCWAPFKAPGQLSTSQTIATGQGGQ